jgi:LysR family nitrogen assimilation transcriptional regulator
MQDWVQEIWLDGASNGAPNVASGQHASWADRTRTLEFRGLRYFVSVARTGTFAAAAQELNVSQVTITRSIQRLEEAVGVKLLTRHGRGASLTSIGSRLAVRLETVLQSVISAAEESPGPTVRGGGLSIALSPEVGLLLAPALLKQCHPRWPLIRLDVREVATDMLADCVLRGLADVAIVQDGISSGNVIVEQVLSERLGLVAAPRHLAAQNAAAVRFRDLLGLPLILPTSQHPNRRRLTKAAYQRGINLHVVSEVDSVPLAKTLVRNELGCAISDGRPGGAGARRTCIPRHRISSSGLYPWHRVAPRPGTGQSYKCSVPHSKIDRIACELWHVAWRFTAACTRAFNRAGP